MKRKIFHSLLKLDSFLDDLLFKLKSGFKNFWFNYHHSFDFVRIRGIKRFFIGLLSTGLTLLFVGLMGLYMIGQYALIDVDEGWQKYQKYSVTFYDKENQVIGVRGIRHRDSVPLNEMPDHMIKAALATEDRKFYDHYGIDPIGIVRAMIHNVTRTSGGFHGASTITQQLAKNLFFSSEQTIERKIKEAYMAIWLESKLTKDEILNLYFDRAYMGAGNFGLEAASQYYFGKTVRDVNLSEAAILAGLFKAPSNYAPHVNLGAARGRANVVLTNMVNAGFVTNGEVFDARSNPASVVKRGKEADEGDYFIDWAFDKAKELADDKAFVLHVKTTLDLKLQRAARKSIQEKLIQQGAQYDVDQGSLVSMEHDGAVLALIGGRDYRKSQFNRAVKAERQPGSSFKPIVYLAALNHGLRPNSRVVDSEVRVKDWAPKNYNRKFVGATSLNNALVRSINTVPIKLAQQVGYKKVISTAKTLGIDAPIAPNASLPLGTTAMSVLDLTGAYATIANGGTLAQPYGILEIRNDSGDIIYNRYRDEFAPQVVANPKKIAQLKFMLGNVVEFGTGKRAILPFTKAYGKTGTTQGYRDAWFVGFTDHIVTGVWYGNDNYQTTKRLTGGSLPAATFNQFMTQAYIDKYDLNIETNKFKAVAAIRTDGQIYKNKPIEQVAAAQVRIKNVTKPMTRTRARILTINSQNGNGLVHVDDINPQITSSTNQGGITLNGRAIGAKKPRVQKATVASNTKSKNVKRVQKTVRKAKPKPRPKPRAKPKRARTQPAPRPRIITQSSGRRSSSSAFIDASGEMVILGN